MKKKLEALKGYKTLVIRRVKEFFYKDTKFTKLFNPVMFPDYLNWEILSKKTEIYGVPILFSKRYILNKNVIINEVIDVKEKEKYFFPGLDIVIQIIEIDSQVQRLVKKGMSFLAPYSIGDELFIVFLEKEDGEEKITLYVDNYSDDYLLMGGDNKIGLIFPEKIHMKKFVGVEVD